MQDMPTNNPLRIFVAAFLTFTALELSRWATLMLKEGSPERIYGCSSLERRRQRFEALWAARYTTKPSTFTYAAAVLCFILFWVNIALATTHMLEIVLAQI